MKKPFAFAMLLCALTIAGRTISWAGSCGGDSSILQRLETQSILEDVGMIHSIDPDLLKAIAKAESGECYDAISPQGRGRPDAVDAGDRERIRRREQIRSRPECARRRALHRLPQAQPLRRAIGRCRKFSPLIMPARRGNSRRRNSALSRDRGLRAPSAMALSASATFPNPSASAKPHWWRRPLRRSPWLIRRRPRS